MLVRSDGLSSSGDDTVARRGKSASHCAEAIEIEMRILGPRHRVNAAPTSV
jgi:hypothetical protein